MSSLRPRIQAFLASGSAISIAEVLALSLLQFLIYAILIRIADTEVVGLWILINSLLVFSRAADVWSQGLSSFVAQARGEGRLGRAASFVTTAGLTGAAGLALLGVVACGVIWVAAPWIVGADYADLVRQILPLMGLTFWLMSVATVLYLAFLGFERPGLKALLTVGGAAVFLVLVVVLTPAYGLWGLLAAQALQAGLVLAVAMALVLKLVILPHGGRFDRALMWEVMTYSVKAMGVGVFQRAIEPVIRLLVSSFGGLGAVTLVELASRLVQTVRGVIVAVGQVMVPAFARVQSGGDPAQMGEMLKASEQRFAVLGSAGFAVLLAAGPVLSTAILGTLDSLFLYMLGALSVGWYCTVIAAPAYFLFQGLRNLRPLYLTHTVMTLGAIVLGGLLGWALGLIGALSGITIALALSAWQLWQGAAATRGGLALRGGTLRIVLPLIAAVVLVQGVLALPPSLLVQIGAPICAAALALLVLPVRDVVSGLVQNQTGRQT